MVTESSYTHGQRKTKFELQKALFWLVHLFTLEEDSKGLH